MLLCCRGRDSEVSRASDQWSLELIKIDLSINTHIYIDLYRCLTDQSVSGGYISYEKINKHHKNFSPILIWGLWKRLKVHQKPPLTQTDQANLNCGFSLLLFRIFNSSQMLRISLRWYLFCENKVAFINSYEIYPRLLSAWVLKSLNLLTEYGCLEIGKIGSKNSLISHAHCSGLYLGDASIMIMKWFEVLHHKTD